MKTTVALVSASAALLILLSGCASGSSADTPASESGESKNKNIASCGVMARMLIGADSVNATNYEAQLKDLQELADNASGDVKTTAQFVLDGIEGKDHSEAESTEQIEKFKDYCRNYTVD